MIYFCSQKNRRALVLAKTGLNGIDYLEVLDHESPVSSLRQRTLLIYCLKPVQTDLTSKNVLIVGGESVTGITAQWIAPATPVPAQITAEAATFSASGDTADATADKTFFANLAAQSNADQILVVRVSQYGDFSRYTFRLVNDAAAAAQDSFDIPEALSTFDPQKGRRLNSACGRCKKRSVLCRPGFSPGCDPVLRLRRLPGERLRSG